MSTFKQISLAGIKTISIKKRTSKVAPADFGRVIDPKNAGVKEFIDSLPRTLASSDLRDLVKDVVRARRSRKPVILMMGAHVIKVGRLLKVTD